MTAIAIIGAGGHGRVVADTAERIGYSEICFLDVNYPEKQQSGEWPIVGKPEACGDWVKFVAIGNNSIREETCKVIGLDGMPTLVDSSAIVSRHSKIGRGVLVVAGAIINVGTEIGDGCIINTGASIDHDCVIGNFAHISPGAHLAGGIEIGNKSWIGAGAVVREGIKIGDNVIVGAGAVVVADIPDSQIVVGNPARPIKENTI
jgi:sugar O-acyltransferase (sialic acid O-acetyltransferase NeuD family)